MHNLVNKADQRYICNQFKRPSPELECRLQDDFKDLLTRVIFGPSWYKETESRRREKRWSGKPLLYGSAMQGDAKEKGGHRTNETARLMIRC